MKKIFVISLIFVLMGSFASAGFLDFITGNVIDNEKLGFRNAHWKCYDDTYDFQGDETSCKSSETWKQYAEEFCKGHCYENNSKCGVNSFSVENECNIEGSTEEIKKCSDSDGGYNPEIKGSITDGIEIFTDYCSGNSVIEYKCDPDGAKGFIWFGSYYCKDGCEDGACIRGSDDFTIIKVWVEEDDANPTHKKLFTEVKKSDGTYAKVSEGFKVEYIISNNKGEDKIGPVAQGGHQSKEYPGEIFKNFWSYSSDFPYCEYNSYKVVVTSDKGIIKTKTGSFKGSCNEEEQEKAIIEEKKYSECIDSDNGVNFKIKGKIKKITDEMEETKEDWCIDENNVVEYYCLRDEIVSEEMVCPPDMLCNEGKCEYQKETKEYCSDSDGGINIFKQGYAKHSRSSEDIIIEKDSCIDKNTLNEVSCKDNSVSIIVLDCPEGYSCSDGECITGIECIDKCGDNICQRETCNEEGCICKEDQKTCSIDCKKEEIKCEGCSDKTGCLPISVRIDGRYCDVDKEMKPQKSSEISCENNYECITNLCIDGKCTEKGLFQKIISWWTNLFG